MKRGSYKKESVADRFSALVVKRPGCWGWSGYLDPNGYGRVYAGAERNTVLAHRVSWELTSGMIPEGVCVLHRCDNPPCTNPEHLFLGTQRDNIADMLRKGRDRRGPGMPGVKHPNARLTDDAVREIRKRCSAGEKQRDVASDLGITQAAVSLVVRRINWSHVP